MLKAILHGKAGRIEHNQDESVSWSQLFKAREDLLTSTIFERFAYLSDEVQHQLLMYWFRNCCGVLPESFGEFVDITYWQRFTHEHDIGSNQVEPDLIIHFEQCNIIVEVKPPAGGNQYLGQWRKEIESFLQSEDDGNSQPLYFLAIGRIEQLDAFNWASQLLPDFEQLKAVAALKWDAVTAQLVDLNSDDSELNLSKQDSRIIRDMLDGLSLYGQQISQFKWSQLATSALPELSLHHPQLCSKPMLATKAEESLTLQCLLEHSLPPLDLRIFQSAFKEIR